VTDKPWKVLVVDDCRKTTELIKRELDGKGFEVHLATSVDQATRLILKEETRPDIVLLDVIMPGVNGEQFCRFIKKNELFSGITVVLCSGMEITELKAVAGKCGADGFVHKESFLGKQALAELLRQQRKPQ
jgi:DNA-binding response OmpR family regulator